MLGFQYVVAKSREFTSALDRELSGGSNRTAPFSSVSSSSAVEVATSNDVSEATTESRNEGHEFLRAQQNLQSQTVYNHQKLMLSGQDLDTALARARATLQAQAASEQFLAQNFHLVSRVRQQLAGVRNLVLKLAQEADEVENLLVHRCEENAARQNAEFATKQQQELEKFEARIQEESEGRKREMLEMRRKKLASAFMNDLKTYQTLVAYHGDAAAAEVTSGKHEEVTLDEVDLVVTADPEQLDAFYDSNSDQEEEPENPRFTSPPAPKELTEEEEEKEEVETIKEVGKAEDGEGYVAEDTPAVAEVVDTEEEKSDDKEDSKKTTSRLMQMEAKKSAVVSESELDKASKGLHVTKGTREHSDSLEYDSQVAEKLKALYEKFEGDIKAIFEELDENPRKAVKHPPTSAAEFGKKYAQGFYTMAEAK